MPAQYQTVQRQVLKAPATTTDVAVPAEYKNVTKQVVVREAMQRVVPVKTGMYTHSAVVSGSVGPTGSVSCAPATPAPARRAAAARAATVTATVSLHRCLIPGCLQDATQTILDQCFLAANF